MKAASGNDFPQARCLPSLIFAGAPVPVKLDGVMVMSFPTAQIHVAALLDAEQTYRRRLQQDPADGQARTNLAWCLLILFAQRAGAEKVMAAGHCWSTGMETLSGEEPAAHRTAAQLLDECLMHTCRAVQLAGTPARLEEAQKLEDLVRMAAGEAAFGAMEERAETAMLRIIQAIRGAPLQELRDE